MGLIGSGEDIPSLSGDHARPYIPQLTFAHGMAKGKSPHTIVTLGKSGDRDLPFAILTRSLRDLRHQKKKCAKVKEKIMGGTTTGGWPFCVEVGTYGDLPIFEPDVGRKRQLQGINGERQSTDRNVGQRARGGEELGNCGAQQKTTDVRQGHGRPADVGWEGSRPECGEKYESKVGVLEIPPPLH